VEYRKNPIRKVVTMLEDMQKNVEEEGEKEEELFNEFMCYCKNGATQLLNAISAGQAQVSELSNAIVKGTSQKSQLDQDITQHKADREAAEKVTKESTAMRQREADEFAKSSGEAKANIQSLTTAVAALKKGLSASLLQTGVGQTIRSVIRTSPLVRDEQREVLLSFLESGSDMAGSDQITGVMEQMLEAMQQDLQETERQESESVATYEALMKSKAAEIAAATKAIETKMSRTGTLAVENVQAKADLKNTETAVAADTQFQANLAKNCAIKQTEYDEKTKIRAEETLAISETIKMLSSDEALELFKKTMPSAAAASFLQISSRSRVRSKAYSTNNVPVLLTLGGGSGGFEKVVGMVDGMVNVLEGEQAQDDKTDKWCIEELNKAEDEEKALATELSEVETAIEEHKDAIAMVASEVEALQAGLLELDKSVAEATEQRKKGHDEYLSTAAANQAAVDLLGMAKNRMNKFYNPTLHKEPAKGEQEEFVQYKKSEAGASVIAMLDDMIKDVGADLSESKRDEEEAQKDYEEDMQDADKKRKDDSALVVTKEAEKAEKVGKQEDNKELKRTKDMQSEVLVEKIKNLHKTCDFLMQQYEKIQDERAKEEEGLKSSKMMLSGAKLEPATANAATEPALEFLQRK